MMKLANAYISKHAESSIELLRDSSGNLFVKKTYNVSSGCILWLNRHLAKYYAPSVAMPVAQHEFAALKILASRDVAPKPVQLDADSITMEYGGVSLEFCREIPYLEYQKQCRGILGLLSEMAFKHNDMLPRNVLISRGKVKLVDFTLSEFNGVSILDGLPDPGWARAGKDSEILGFFPSRMTVLKQRFRQIAKRSALLRSVRGIFLPKPYLEAF